jgi:type I restriction enzyme S subunit
MGYGSAFFTITKSSCSDGIGGDAGMSHNFVQLGSIAEFINGAAFKPEDWGESGLRIIRIQNLTDSNKPFNRTERIVSERVRVQQGDLLVSWSATLGIFEWHDSEEALLNQHIFRVLPNEEKVNKRYLRHGLEGAILDMQKHLHGATMQHVNRGEFLGTKLYLPPLEEQKRIAEILDQAEELRTKRRDAIAQLNTLTQSIFLEMFGDPVVNRKKWEVRNMNECAERIQIGPFGTQLHEEDYIENGIPLINPTHIQDGKIFPNTSFSISNEKHQQLSQYHLEVDDVILGRRGEMGRCAIISEYENGWLCGTGSLFLRPKQALINSFYLFSVLSSKSIKKYLEKASQGVTMANLNKTIVSQIPVILPPLPLQREFAKRIEAVEKLKTAHRASLSELDALFASLQHRAFRGEL